MIVLDTTVLLYALGGDHPLRAPARRIITAIGDGRLAATTTPEVLQGFTHVRARRRGRADAVVLAQDLATLLTPLTVVTADDLRRGLAVFERTDQLGAFDAVLVALARRLDVPIVSADRVLLAALGELGSGLDDARWAALA